LRNLTAILEVVLKILATMTIAALLAVPAVEASAAT